MTKYGNKEEIEDKRALYNNTDSNNKDMGQEFDNVADEVSKGLLGKVSTIFDKTITTVETWVPWIPPPRESTDKPVTREEVLAYINKRMDSHIFIERNCSSLMNEDQILRLSKIKEYIGENLK